MAIAVGRHNLMGVDAMNTSEVVLLSRIYVGPTLQKRSLLVSPLAAHVRTKTKPSRELCLPGLAGVAEFKLRRSYNK